MATQPAIDLGGTPFLDRTPRESHEQILVNSTRIRYPAGTIAFQPGDADRADILESGPWLRPSSWDRGAAVFDEAGFTAVSPGWPDDPATVAEAKAHPEVFAHLPLPFSALKAAAPVLSNPANRGRAIPLTYDQFRFALQAAAAQ